jgi:hypothetical protein
MGLTGMMCSTNYQMLYGKRDQDGASALPYARMMLRAGLAACVEQLHTISPELATLFLDVSLENENLTDLFLLSAWGTLTARMHPSLTETVIRSLARSDFTAEQILAHLKPVMVYLRWKKQDLFALSSLVRLLRGSLIDELVTIYDHRAGRGCQPVMLLIDEAGRTSHTHAGRPCYDCCRAGYKHMPGSTIPFSA